MASDEHGNRRTIVDALQMSRIVSNLVSKCQECSELPNDFVALCDQHNNSHELSLKMRATKVSQYETTATDDTAGTRR